MPATIRQIDARKQLKDFTVDFVSEILNGPFTDVRSYGADSTGAADSTAAIQAAIDALQVATRGYILFPVGNYKITTTISITGSNVVLIGQGYGSRIAPTFTSGVVFDFSGDGLGGSTGYRNGFEHLFVDAPLGATVTALRIDGQVQFRAESNMLNNVGVGISIEGPTTTSIVRIHHNDIEGLKPVTGIGILQTGGADIYIDTNTILGFYDSQPAAGIAIGFSTGTKILHNDLFATGFGLLVNPGNGKQVIALESVANWYDSGSEDAIALVPSGTGKITVSSSSVDWFVSAGRNGIEIGSDGTVDGFVFTQPRVQNNGQHGVLYNGGLNVAFIDAQVSGNSTSSSGMYHGFNASAGNFCIRGGVFGQLNPWGNTQGWGILISVGAFDNYQITGARFTTNVTGLLGDGGTGAHKLIKDNLGISDVVPVVASATALDIGTGGWELYQITGTTAVTSILRGWMGRRIRLYKTDTGTVTVMGYSLAQNKSIDLVCVDGTNWY